MEGEEDDQGSGWLEVKKKHRSSSKLSLQKVSGGGSFNKRQSFTPFFQVSKNHEFKHLPGKCELLSTNEGPAYALHSETASGGHVDNGVECFEKVVNNKKSGPSDFLTCTLEKVEAPEDEAIETHEVLMKENVTIVTKIKWGDLEDSDLSLSAGCEAPGENVKTQSVDCLDGLQEDPEAANHGDPLISTSSFSPLQVDVTSEDIKLFPGPPMSDHDESSDKTWKEVSEVPSDDVELVSHNPKDVADMLNNTCHNRITGTTELKPVDDLCPDDAFADNELSIPVAEIENMSLEEPCNKIDDRTPRVSEVEVSVIDENAGRISGPRDTNLPLHLSDGAEIFVEASSSGDRDDLKREHCDLAEGADVVEGEQGESKGRFRERLWCFLFENLNRAVDELYLLCELECDMEQMTEAILVLEEAASDFKELKCRVEHFENTKRATPQTSTDGVPLNVKSDHRRPHALSWEVRRMTTSPHRAEILSSSLEAFKKIQMQRVSRHVNRDEDLSNSLLNAQQPRSPERGPSENKEQSIISEKQRGTLSVDQGNAKVEKQIVDASRQSKAGLVQAGRSHSQSQSVAATGKLRREPLETISESEKQLSRRDRTSTESKADKQPKAPDAGRKHNSSPDKEREKEKEKHNMAPWKPMDAWKEKRNWEDILKSPLRSSTRVSHSPGLARKGVERARVLHDKLMSPEKKKKTALDLKREAEEKHARAMRIRSQLENERVQRLQRTSDKLNRVNEWQAVRSSKLREGMYARHQRSESRHEAYLAQVVKRAGDESSKVNEVRFITSLNEENKKLMLRQKLHDSEMRRAEKLQVIRIKQKEDTAREEAALERRKLLEAEKLQRLAETQRKKEEAQARREEERKASSAAREAKALEQLRKKEVRARAQQEEAELLAQRLAERLRESEQRRKSYLEQIREKASMDFRDQSSPLLRRSLIKEGQSRLISTSSIEDYQTSGVNATQQQSMKRRIKKIRQKLMSLKYEFVEPPVSTEISGIAYRASVGTARAKIGRWLQDLQRLRQARKEGAASIGLIVGEMVKFLEGKDPELHAARQAGLLDFISSALPASHTSKPAACQVTLYLLQLLSVVLSLPANRSYFLAQNLLPPVVPLLSASIENYIKIAASSNAGSSNLLAGKSSVENLEAIGDVLDGFLWIVTVILGHARTDERQLQMQDGLLELIVAYQIIHRLRDLFALYDRPQVEGSAFPTSILLSLNLLAVLTSMPRTISSIDWEDCMSCMSKVAERNKVQETKSLQSPDIGYYSLVNNPSNMNLPQNGSAEKENVESPVLLVPEVPDSSPGDGKLREDSSLMVDSQRCDGSVECTKTTSSEVQNVGTEEHIKSISPQKNGKNSIDDRLDRKRMDEQMLHDNGEIKKASGLKQPIVFLLSVITETGLVGLPSLLTAVLLQANNRLSSEQASYILPSNFDEVATGVLKVLNNLALLDIALLQETLARPDLKMEFFHLMSFLLSYCTSKWKAASDQVGLLLFESLLLLGYFALFHPGNQAVLRWGKSPTILHKICDLPFVFFSDQELTPILASTLVAACYGCEQNRGLVLQELSVDMLLSLLKSYRQGLVAAQSELQECSLASEVCDGTQPTQEARKPQADIPTKPNRKINRLSLGKASLSTNNVKIGKVKTQKDSRGTKTCDEWALKHNLPSSETSHSFMLHQRFPTILLDKAEQFFTSGRLELQVQ